MAYESDSIEFWRSACGKMDDRIIKLEADYKALKERNLDLMDSSQLPALRQKIAASEAEKLEAFCQGARWWEFKSTGGTMWQSDQDLAFTAASEGQENASLGIRVEDRADRHKG